MCVPFGFNPTLCTNYTLVPFYIEPLTRGAYTSLKQTQRDLFPNFFFFRRLQIQWELLISHQTMAVNSTTGDATRCRFQNIAWLMCFYYLAQSVELRRQRRPFLNPSTASPRATSTLSPVSKRVSTTEFFEDKYRSDREFPILHNSINIASSPIIPTSFVNSEPTIETLSISNVQLVIFLRETT